MGYIGTGYQFLSANKGSDIASATTITIDGTSAYFDVTGTTSITGMTVDSSRQFTLQFDGALTLTHGASLNLPSAANITTAAGDEALFQSTGADTVRCISYSKADGTAVVAAGGGDLVLLSAQTAANDTTMDFDGFFTSAYDVYKLTYSNVHSNSDGTDARLRVMIAASIKTDATGYSYAVKYVDDAGSDSLLVSTGTSGIRLNVGVGTAAGESENGEIVIHDPLGTDNFKGLIWTDHSTSNTPATVTSFGSGVYDVGTTALTGVSWDFVTNNVVTGEFRLYGLKNS